MPQKRSTIVPHTINIHDFPTKIMRQVYNPSPVIITLIVVTILLSPLSLAAIDRNNASTLNANEKTVQISPPIINDNKQRPEPNLDLDNPKITDLPSSNNRPIKTLNTEDKPASSKTVAQTFGVSESTVESDFQKIKPTKNSDDTITPQFPTIIITFEGETSTGEFFKAYIGRQRRLSTGVAFQGRILFTVSKQSYMIVNGDGDETSFGLVLIKRGQPSQESSPSSKMFINFNDETGSFSNLQEKPGTIDFKITSLSRKPLLQDSVEKPTINLQRKSTDTKPTIIERIFPQEDNAQTGISADSQETQTQSKSFWQRIKSIFSRN
jgi:hypothetical protein